MAIDLAQGKRQSLCFTSLPDVGQKLLESDYQGTGQTDKTSVRNFRTAPRPSTGKREIPTEHWHSCSSSDVLSCTKGRSLCRPLFWNLNADRPEQLSLLIECQNSTFKENGEAPSWHEEPPLASMGTSPSLRRRGAFLIVQDRRSQRKQAPCPATPGRGLFHPVANHL